ncbi:MAG TPA: hypothetical protein DCL76_03910 [Chloroflexi bacterium]|nr:hypothetical protein [Chloroflexota bacterium]HCU99032.1 hypothetical protein [Chloroflexota bacterium]
MQLKKLILLKHIKVNPLTNFSIRVFLLVWYNFALLTRPLLSMENVMMLVRWRQMIKDMS